jgi:hypothetical protein
LGGVRGTGGSGESRKPGVFLGSWVRGTGGPGKPLPPGLWLFFLMGFANEKKTLKKKPQALKAFFTCDTASL